MIEEEDLDGNDIDMEANDERDHSETSAGEEIEVIVAPKGKERAKQGSSKCYRSTQWLF